MYNHLKLPEGLLIVYWKCRFSEGEKLSNNAKKYKISKTMVLAIVGSMMLVAMVGLIIRIFWYKRQCDIIYAEVNASVVECGEEVYGEYDGQMVLLSQANLSYVLRSVTDKMVVISSRDEIPEGEPEPVRLHFGDVLLMEVYPGEDNKVFIKHSINKTTKYYVIDGTCNFNNLKKMVSIDEWSYPNYLVEDE